MMPANKPSGRTKIMQRKRILILCGGVALTVLSLLPNAFGGGLEKVVSWSGRYAGVANAAVGNVAGAESLYFNPAGLAAGQNADISLNFSPTFARYSGPVTAAGTQLDSSRKFTPPFAVLARHKVTDQLGVGIGAFASGGTKAIYEGVDFGFSALKPTVKADLNIIELSAGAGYEILPQLRFGVAWRAVMVQATLGSALVLPNGGGLLTTVDIHDLSATRYNGFRVGAQYGAEDNSWGLGVNWRTEVGFTAKGTSTGSSQLTGSTAALASTGGDVTVSNAFPTQIAFGGFYDVNKGLKLFGEYDWSRYNVNQALRINGNVILNPALGGSTLGIPSIPQNWQNMHNLKFGLECTHVETWAFRAGYAFTSPVTPKSSARATFVAPAVGHTFTLGAGKLIASNWNIDGAVEYSRASATVTADDILPGAATLAGDYKADVYVLHTGVSYRF